MMSPINKRTILLVFLFSCAVVLSAQAKSTFIRVFNPEGHLLIKGNLVGTTDSSLIIQQRKKQVEIPVSTVGFIKTARTFVHGIGVGATIGAIVCGIIGAAVGSDSGTEQFTEFDSQGMGFAGGVIIGATGGAVIGAAISSAQKRRTIVINGNLNEWQQKKQLLNAMIPAAQ